MPGEPACGGDDTFHPFRKLRYDETEHEDTKLSSRFRGQSERLCEGLYPKRIDYLRK